MLNKKGLDVQPGQTVFIRGSKCYILHIDETSKQVLVSGWNGFKTTSFDVEDVKEIVRQEKL